MPKIQTLIENFTNQFSSLRLNFSSWDFLILLFLVVVSVVYAMFFVSRGRIVPILISSYMAFLLVYFAPFLTAELASSLGLEKLFLLKILAFAAAFLLILFILSHVILQSPVGAETFGILSSLVLAFAQVGFLLAAFISFLPKEITRDFSPFIRQIFIGSDQFFYWAVAPIVLLLVIAWKVNKRVG